MNGCPFKLLKGYLKSSFWRNVAFEFCTTIYLKDTIQSINGGNTLNSTKTVRYSERLDYCLFSVWKQMLSSY